MTDIASLSIAIDSSSATPAAKALDEVTAAGARLEQQNYGVTDSSGRVTEAGRKAWAQLNNTKVSTEGLSEATQKLLNRYDPLGTKLRQLEADYIALNKASAAGLLGPATGDKSIKIFDSLNDQLAKTKDLMAAAGVATQGNADKAISLGLNTAYARRELLVLGHEAMNGNFSRMPGTFMALAGHSNILTVAFHPVTLGILAIAAAAGVMITAMVQGGHEMKAMNDALASTSNFAQLTRQGMLDMSQSVADSGKLTVGTAKDIITQVVASGRYGSENVQAMAVLTERYAAVTGESIDKVTPKLIQMFEKPTQASEKLNQQYHYLGVTELERIKNLEQTGRVQEAVTLAVQALTNALPEHSQNLSRIERNWIAIKKAASEGWAAMTGAMAPQSPEERLATEQAKLRAMGGDHLDKGGGTPEQKAQAQIVESLRTQLELSRQMAILKGVEAQLNERQLNAHKEAEKSVLGQITNLERARDLLKAEPDAALRERRTLEINKQIRDLRLGMGAEAKSIHDQQLAGELTLYETRMKGYHEQVSAMVTLGQMTKGEGLEAQYAMDVTLNGEKQLSIQQQLRYGNLKKLEQDKLNSTLANLQAEMKVRKQKYEDDVAVEQNRMAGVSAEGSAKAQAAIVAEQMKSLEEIQKAIDAQKLHNAELGQTKDKVGLLKAAELDRAISRLEYDRTMNEGDEAYIARLDQQIAKLREQQELIRTGAAIEKQLADKKAMLDEFNTLWSTVERTGKDVFTHVSADGVSSMQTIGKAIKSSVIDMLYQLTVRRWMITIGANMTDMMGLTTGAAAKAAAAESGGGLFGAIGKMLGFGGGNVATSVATSSGEVSVAEAFASGVIPMAAGGDFIVDKPTLFLAGEAGQERASFSGANRASSGAGGTSISIPITVDARGADAGSAYRIEQMVGQMQREIVPKVLDAIRRGGNAHRFAGR